MRHHVDDESARTVVSAEWRKLKEWKNGGVGGMEDLIQWCWSLDMSTGSVHHNMNNRTSILFHSNKLNVLGASWIQGRVYHQHQHCLWTIAASKVDQWRDNNSKQATNNDYQLDDCREISRESRKRSRNRMSKPGSVMQTLNFGQEQIWFLVRSSVIKSLHASVLVIYHTTHQTLCNIHKMYKHNAYYPSRFLPSQSNTW